MKLYKIIQTARLPQYSGQLLASQVQLSDDESAASTSTLLAPSTPASSSRHSLSRKRSRSLSAASPSGSISQRSPRSTSSTSSGSPPTPLAREAKRPRLMPVTKFSLPDFADEIESCIERDEVYTSQQRCKVIRETCRALQGYCKKQQQPVTASSKKMAAELLSKKCPNSLGSEVFVINCVEFDLQCPVIKTLFNTYTHFRILCTFKYYGGFKTIRTTQGRPAGRFWKRENLHQSVPTAPTMKNLCSYILWSWSKKAWRNRVWGMLEKLLVYWALRFNIVGSGCRGKTVRSELQTLLLNSQHSRSPCM